MWTISTFAFLMWLCFFQSGACALLRRQVPPSTTCTTTALEPVPYGLQCGVQGELANPKTIQPPFTASGTSPFITCRNDCLSNKICESFSFDLDKNICSLYSENLGKQGFQYHYDANSVVYYNSKCFGVSCGSVSTCTQQPFTTVSTLTSTITITTTPSSSKPTSSPICTQKPVTTISTSTSTVTITAMPSSSKSTSSPACTQLPTTITSTLISSITIFTISTSSKPSGSSICSQKLVTTISTLTSTVTITTTTSSSKPTGSPVCTQAANPIGTCGFAADYSGATAPQLWAGTAASLDACAVSCEGEPGCQSLMYNPSGSLQCVLFDAPSSKIGTTGDNSSALTFYDYSCFSCSGLASLPPTDDGCTPALQPPPGSSCGLNALYGGIPMDEISAPGNTATSQGACMQQCLSQTSCLSIAFDGTNCQLFSLTVYQLELNGVYFPVNPGVAGAVPLSDIGCLVCPKLGCSCNS